MIYVTAAALHLATLRYWHWQAKVGRRVTGYGRADADGCRRVTRHVCRRSLACAGYSIFFKLARGRGSRPRADGSLAGLASAKGGGGSDGASAGGGAGSGDTSTSGAHDVTMTEERGGDGASTSGGGGGGAGTSGDTQAGANGKRPRGELSYHRAQAPNHRTWAR